ncbi:MAG: YfcE family phosphodiesterase [Thermosphaera sp.]
MNRVLVLGDTHIPDRARRVPQNLSNLIEREYWDYVIFTGDLTSPEVRSWVENLGERVVLVRGNMDYLPLPLHEKIVIEEVTLGVYHGHGIYPRGNIDGLARIGLGLGVDLLASGHTHLSFIRTDVTGKVLLINPGSATGAWSGELESGPPSLIVMDIEKNVLRASIIYVSQDVLKHTTYVLEKKDRWFVYPMEK